MSKPAGKCIFCGSGDLTHEHVWPDWLKRYLPREQKSHTRSRTFIRPGDVRVINTLRTGDPGAWRIRCVCRSCNSTWMNAIHQNARALIIALITGQPIRLGSDEQSKLAAWIAMATMVAEFAHRDSVAIPDDDRKYLHDNEQSPGRWKIWIGDFDRSAWRPRYIHQPVAVVEQDIFSQAVTGSGKYNTQTTTYTIGRAYIHVLSSVYAEIPRDFQLVGRPRSLLRQIFPVQRHYSLVWPRPP